MKLFSSGQIKEIDSLTTANEPIKSIDLMERASGQLFTWITSRFERSHRILVFAGPGNNGGDGLALARMFYKARYAVEVYYVKFTENVSPDWQINRKRLQDLTEVPFNVVEAADQFPLVSDNDVIIDAIFGSGLARPVSGIASEIIREMNRTACLKIAVDIPSGLFGESNEGNDTENIFRADYTLSFQFPKLSFMFAENHPFTGNWNILPIGLDETAIKSVNTPYRYVEGRDVAVLLKKRNKFDHKGNYGHGLLIAGSSGKIGAAILGARAALRTGIGLLTCNVPDGAQSAMHSSVPEAMLLPDRSHEFISDIRNPEIFSAVAAGPGLGTAKDTQSALYRLYLEYHKPMVIDADALNILSMNPDWFSFFHQEIIITPHPREFERLAGKCKTGYERLLRQIDFSTKHGCIVILKGACTSVSMPDGRVFFNSTGNPGMATAGSGDVLTGILLSLLAQGYFAEDAAVLGVYLHGLAGDIAAEELSAESIIASDIINCIGKAFKKLHEAEI